MENRDPRARLLELAEARKASLAQLSALIGRNASYLQQFVRKGSPRKLEENDRRVLARFFGVDESELGGAGENSPGIAGKPSGADWIDVPRLALGASAGPGSLAGEELAFGSLRFSARWLRGQGLDPGKLSAIAVSGDSMDPTLRDGDEILVDRTPRPLRDGVHVVRVEDAVLVKRLDTGLPGRITLISDNPAYRPLDLAPAEVQVIGRVVWKGGRL
ncbi:MAG TPA: S24 family peptidase [Novosphingobium sp.]|nr:S24 family peptidase [Novosphingobium sp.]